MYIDGDKKVEIIKCKDVILFYSILFTYPKKVWDIHAPDVCSKLKQSHRLTLSSEC